MKVTDFYKNSIGVTVRRLKNDHVVKEVSHSMETSYTLYEKDDIVSEQLFMISLKLKKGAVCCDYWIKYWDFAYGVEGIDDSGLDKEDIKDIKSYCDRKRVNVPFSVKYKEQK